MPDQCSAGYCSNGREAGFSLHKFPQEESVRKKWIQQVRRTRSGPNGTPWQLNDSAFLCSAHFDESCFDPAERLKQQFGLKPVNSRKILLAGAIPSIFPRGRETAAQPGPAVRTRKSGAIEKRRHLEILQECMPSEVTTTTTATEEGEDLPADSNLFVETNVTPTERGVQVCMKPETRTVATLFRGYGQSRRSKGVQTVTPSVRTIGTQTEITSEFFDQCSDSEDQMSVSEEDSMSISTDDPDYEPDCDPDYDPLDDSDEDISAFENTETNGNTENMETSDSEPGRRIFLVFWTCLAQLFSVWCSCPMCPNRKLAWSCKEVGTLVQVTIKCTECSYEGLWNSQPFFGKTAAGNILLSASILFSGATPTKVLRVLSHMGVALMSIRSFFRHQERVLFKAVYQLWAERQVWDLSLLQAEREPIICGGDGRADTPGHSAKYGTYTMMELRKNVVIDVQLVQSNEVGGSYHMEKEGLERSLHLLQDTWNLDVGTLVTDRHSGIIKWLRDHQPDIIHLFDIWHVAKNIKKKLQGLSRTTECQALRPWVSSIINHLYWSVVSTPHGEGELITDKWTSVVQHIHNRHTGFPGQFPACIHEPLEGRELRKPWLPSHTKVSIEVEKVVCRKKLCGDIKRLSPVHQTSSLEAFHSLINHFAPKMYHFCYEGMECRVILAAMHWNENGYRAQHTTGDGKATYSLHYPKHKKGGHVVRKVLANASFGYVKRLLNMVEKICSGQSYDGDDMEVPDPARIPEPLSASFHHPNMEAAIQAHATRLHV
ncbi:uncharacterized protein [Branchiostoma lanceolatum]|uniref:uncharacterized protein n=1 Tax=Branchiostoma lanceolatum TaxID=7740 RepID=UPI003455580F